MTGLADVVYVCGPQVGEELRYSLRSLANLRHGRVWIVGHRPDWARVEHVAVEQCAGKYANVLANIKAALAEPRISDPFLLFNDDFFVMQPADDVPVMHCGTVTERLSCRSDMPRGQYRADLVAAQKLLQSRGHADPLCYDLHVPMVVDKRRLRETLDVVGGSRMLWQTVHGNLHRLGGTFHPDAKVRSLTDEGPDGPFLSTSDKTFPHGAVGRRIRKAFPERSPYE